MGGLEKAIGQSAKHCVIAAVSIVILLSESLLPIYYVVAAMGNAVFSKFLKKIIREPRPVNSPKKGHGMPSSHAQSIYYFATLIITKDAAYITSEPAVPLLHFCVGLVGILVVLSYSYYACAYRISSGRHTLAQTVVGAVVGAVVALSACAAESTALSLYNIAVEAPTHNTQAPLWLRGAVVTTCVVGLYAKEEIFSLLQLGRSVA